MLASATSDNTIALWGMCLGKIVRPFSYTAIFAALPGTLAAAPWPHREDHTIIIASPPAPSCARSPGHTAR